MLDCYDTVGRYLLGMETIHVVEIKCELNEITYIPRFDYSHDNPECFLPIYNISPDKLGEDIVIKRSKKFKVYCPHCKKYFWTTIHKHLTLGEGCPTCPIKYQDFDNQKYHVGSKSHAAATINMLLKLHNMHDCNEYDYCMSFHSKTSEKILIYCINHDRWFWQMISDRLRYNGCRLCGIAKRSKKRTLTTTIVKQRLIERWGDSNMVAEVEYVNAKTKIRLICKYHGPYYQLYHASLRGQLCPKCTGNSKLDTKGFIRLSKDAFDNEDMFIYPKTKYVNMQTEVCITCNRCNNEFWQNPEKHLMGRDGCIYCVSTGGFNASKPATFYYLQFDTPYGKLYKLGVTNQSIDARYGNGEAFYPYIIIYQHLYEDGAKALRRETSLKRQFTSETFDGPRIFRRTGNNEVYPRDVLNLNNQY